MRAERTPGNGVVVADGDRTRYPGGAYVGTRKMSPPMAGKLSGTADIPPQATIVAWGVFVSPIP